MFTKQDLTDEQMELFNRLYEEVMMLLYVEDLSNNPEMLQQVAETIMELHKTEKKTNGVDK